jgi:hypothetical protein
VGISAKFFIKISKQNKINTFQNKRKKMSKIVTLTFALLAVFASLENSAATDIPVFNLDINQVNFQKCTKTINFYNRQTRLLF